ncbi:RidA family protein [Pelagibaculum spongiae]|uniref:Reactive intermediate/imine deaminase n=1 Tax=Pelagibaculum spongiae TaxID=2080658 RepID=A0A2V1H1U4_9GAMM|nr:RidA family protein [Pelagibaculum spongiae]PVZ70351.1 reactive intermediate/imine deaminase [Pelagibaculum spongiae]
MNNAIHTDQAPAAVGPYSQAIQAGNQLFVSGQIPFIPETMTLVSEDVAEQTKQSLVNLKSIIESAGFAMTDVVKCTIFIKDMNEFATINEVYAGFFEQPFPARACVEVARLPKDVKVEIDAVCIKS